jgi:hypothetical protein
MTPKLTEHVTELFTALKSFIRLAHNFFKGTNEDETFKWKESEQQVKGSFALAKIVVKNIINIVTQYCIPSLP